MWGVCHADCVDPSNFKKLGAFWGDIGTPIILEKNKKKMLVEPFLRRARPPRRECEEGTNEGSKLWMLEV